MLKKNTFSKTIHFRMELCYEKRSQDIFKLIIKKILRKLQPACRNNV